MAGSMKIGLVKTASASNEIENPLNRPSGFSMPGSKPGSYVQSSYMQPKLTTIENVSAPTVLEQKESL